MRAGYVYILGSLTGVLYVGVTSNLDVRILQHRDGTYKGFTAQYHCYRLLYYEKFEDISKAIAREKEIKSWRRVKKLNLIREVNPKFNVSHRPWAGRLLQSTKVLLNESHATALPDL
jgi:putative endonuclease